MKSIILSIRRHRKALSLLLAAISLVLLGVLTANTDSRRFHRTTDALFQEEMLSNTLNMHYTIAVPQNYGIEKYQVLLPGYDAKARTQNTSRLQEYLEIFQGLDASRLSKEDADTLELLIPYLENSLELYEFSYYEEPLSPARGMQSQLPILLAEYTFRTRQDVEDYLQLLEQTDTYLLSLLTYEQEKAANGLLMASTSLEKVIEQCDSILTKAELDEGTHFLQTTFQERLLLLAQKESLTKEDISTYLRQNDRLLSTVMLPAYTALGEGLGLLQKDCGTLSGLASQPLGRQYYEKLLISETGSYRSIEDIRRMLNEKLQEESEALAVLLSQYRDTSLSSLQSSVAEQFPLTEADRMLDDLIDRMRSDFPSPVPADSPLPGVHIKKVSKSLEAYCAPAFYLTPPLDDTDNNVIYINQKNRPDAPELYTTLAHEGYPGHMYQSVYHNNRALSSASNIVRQLLWYGGYLEGWALYVELTSFDYASLLMEAAGYDKEAGYIQIEKHSRNLQLCLYSLLDIMIHYDGLSYSGVHKALAAFGITSPDSTKAIYTYIAEEPANYPKYYLGYLEILSLKEQANNLWGDAYTELHFHEFLLNNGPADFSYLAHRLEEVS